MAKDDTTKPAQPKKPSIFRRAGGRAASLLGFTDIKRGLEQQVETIAESGERTKKLIDGYRAKLQKREVRVETFEEAVRRLGLTKKDLARRRKELSFASYAYMALFALTLFFLMIGALNRHWIAMFTICTFLLTEGALIFQTRFRIWQIDTRRLGSPKEFVNAALGRA